MYLSNNIIKFTNSTKLTDDKTFGINGFHSKVQLVKSRTNRAGQELQMIYNQDYGFDRHLTNFQALKDADLIRGSGTWFYLDGLPSVKFQQKQFLQKFYENPLLRRAMMETCVELYQSYIPKFAQPSSEMTEDEIISNLIDAYDDPDETFEDIA